MKLKKIVRRNKKAVSPMIGYILLISAAIFMSVIVYAWLKTYVPRAALECPETTSIFIESYTCIPNNQLNITIRNNGNFNVAGYFIRISNKTGQTLATVDLSSKLQSEFEGITIGNSVLFSKNDPGNSFTPNDETTNVFDILSTIDSLVVFIRSVNMANASC